MHGWIDAYAHVTCPSDIAENIDEEGMMLGMPWRSMGTT